MFDLRVSQAMEMDDLLLGATTPILMVSGPDTLSQQLYRTRIYDVLVRLGVDEPNRNGSCIMLQNRH